METCKKDDYTAVGISREIVYKRIDVYDLSSESGVSWNDETVGGEWLRIDVSYKTLENDEKHEEFDSKDLHGLRSGCDYLERSKVII